MADLLGSLNGSAKVSMSISLAGTNVFEVGNVVSAYQVSPYGAPALQGFDGTDGPALHGVQQHRQPAVHEPLRARLRADDARRHRQQRDHLRRAGERARADDRL